LRPTKPSSRPTSSIAEVERAVTGVQGIVHLGGFSVEGPWDTILNSNIIGTYNLFEAARRHVVERVVFASSNHAVDSIRGRAGSGPMLRCGRIRYGG
jgi:uronate dehydrogenase